MNVPTYTIHVLNYDGTLPILQNCNRISGISKKRKISKPFQDLGSLGSQGPIRIRFAHFFAFFRFPFFFFFGILVWDFQNFLSNPGSFFFFRFSDFPFFGFSVFRIFRFSDFPFFGFSDFPEFLKALFRIFGFSDFPEFQKALFRIFGVSRIPRFWNVPLTCRS